MDCDWLLVMTDGMGGEPQYRPIHGDSLKEAKEAATGFLVEEQRKTDQRSREVPFVVTGVLFLQAAEWDGKCFAGHEPATASKPVSS